jgi:hypothetical protein
MMELFRLDWEDRMNQKVWVGAVLNRLGRDEDALFHSQQWLEDETKRDGPPERAGSVFKKPVRKIGDAVNEKYYSECATGIIYTAALSSFRLWGDCQESRQYVRAAAKANPHVLVRIMGRRSRPGMCYLHFSPKAASSNI